MNLVKKLESDKEKLEWRVSDSKWNRDRVFGGGISPNGWPGDPFAFLDYLNPINYVKAGVLSVSKTYNQVMLTFTKATSWFVSKFKYQ